MYILQHFSFSYAFCKLIYFSAEPGLVENLQLTFTANEDSFNSTSGMHTLDMNIMWEEPVNPNGVITSYEVTVAQTDNSNDIVYSDNVTVTSVTQSVMVLPFTSYTVTVTASTSAGQGDPESVVEVSPEAGKWTIIYTYFVVTHTDM